MKGIELILPGKNPVTIMVSAIQSILFTPQDEGMDGYGDRVFITISGWDKPYVFEGHKAREVYDKLGANLEIISIHVDSSVVGAAD